jgi:hypothetical protein
MIPQTEYIQLEGLSGVTFEQIEKYHTKEEVQNFNKWITGQTCSIYKDKPLIYSWDYERWVRQGMKISQGKDWD